ncbi:hypothetical protein ACHAWO_004483 [Cyclotella atomus]|uniref:Uncharacterized protein n=1 Tax=Cyclotella atomus TaxID=382360 RepID=A0ABD3NW24_9STRA
MYLSLNLPLVSQSSSDPVPPMMPHENAPSHALRFPQRNHGNKRALDIGCAVDGSAFELSKSFCIELFIQAAMTVQKENKISFHIPMEGELYKPATAKLPADSTSTDNIHFFVGDAYNMPPTDQLEEYTPKDKWIGGCTYENGSAVDSKQKLREIMERKGFGLIHDEAVPLVIREHARKYQYIISDATRGVK